MRSPLRSPAQVEGTQGFLPQPGKALERPSSTRLEARFPYHGSGAMTRSPSPLAAVLCGREWFDGVMHGVDPATRVHWAFDEGAELLADSVVCRVDADARALLSAERPALNFLQLLSATATATRSEERRVGKECRSRWSPY